MQHARQAKRDGFRRCRSSLCEDLSLQHSQELVKASSREQCGWLLFYRRHLGIIFEVAAVEAEDQHHAQRSVWHNKHHMRRDSEQKPCERRVRHPSAALSSAGSFVRSLSPATHILLCRSSSELSADGVGPPARRRGGITCSGSFPAAESTINTQSRGLVVSDPPVSSQEGARGRSCSLAAQRGCL